jgi:Ser/Thr protein kinase RdoA (MazF antagonist)
MVDKIKYIYSTVSPNTIVKLVKNNYHLDDLTDCYLYRRGFNDIYILKTNLQSFIGRIYRSDKYFIKDKKSIIFELELLNFLKSKGISVSSPLMTINNDYLVEIECVEGRRYFSIFDYVQGEDREILTSQEFHTLGELVAKIHHYGDKFAEKFGKHRHNIDFDFLINDILELLRSHIDQKLYIRIYEYFENAKKEILKLDINTKNFGFIHGDIHSGNFKIDNNQIALFDFDHSGFGWRGYDLSTIYQMAVEKQNLVKWEAFLKGYSEYRVIPDNELSLMKLFIDIRNFWDTGEFLRFGYFYGQSAVENTAKRLEKVFNEIFKV